MAKNESKTLNESLDGHIDPNLKANLENLKGLGVDPTLFAQFEARVNEIIWENPGSEGVVAAELQKTTLNMEQLFAWYNRQFRSIVTTVSANDDIFWADDELAA